MKTKSVWGHLSASSYAGASGARIVPSRTMQFVIEHPCPVLNQCPTSRALAHLPMVVWVLLPQCAPPDSGPDCGGPYYQLDAVSSMNVFGRIHSKADQPIVCAHMGRLIE